jgi:hypothetical protein
MPRKDKRSLVPSYLWLGAALLSAFTGTYLNENLFLLIGCIAAIVFVFRDSKLLLHFEAHAQLGGDEAPVERRLTTPVQQRKKLAAKVLPAGKPAPRTITQMAIREAMAETNDRVAREEWDRQLNEHLATVAPLRRQLPKVRRQTPGKKKRQGKKSKKNKKR